MSAERLASQESKEPAARSSLKSRDSFTVSNTSISTGGEASKLKVNENKDLKIKE